MHENTDVTKKCSRCAQCKGTLRSRGGGDLCGGWGCEEAASTGGDNRGRLQATLRGAAPWRGGEQGRQTCREGEGNKNPASSCIFPWSPGRSPVSQAKERGCLLILSNGSPWDGHRWRRVGGESGGLNRRHPPLQLRC